MDISFTLPAWAMLPAWVYATWICFVMMIAAKESKKRNKKIRPILWLFFAPFLLGIGVLDVGAQLTIAWLLLWEKPKEWTLSARMKRYRTVGGTRWQVWVANKLCGGLLNPIDPEGHC